MGECKVKQYILSFALFWLGLWTVCVRNRLWEPFYKYSAVARGGAGGAPGPPIIFERWREKGNNRWDPHIYELGFKIGCICSDFRNENFKNFQVFSPWAPLISLGQVGPPQNILPSYGTEINLLGKGLTPRHSMGHRGSWWGDPVPTKDGLSLLCFSA